MEGRSPGMKVEGSQTVHGIVSRAADQRESANAAYYYLT